MNRACERCKNAAKTATNTPVSPAKPKPSATYTPRLTLTPTRTTAARTATPALPSSISGSLTTTYTITTKTGIKSSTVYLAGALVTVSLAGKQMVTYTDEKGNFNIPDVSQQLRGTNPANLSTTEALIQVDLRSINPTKITTPNFEIYYQNQTKPISLSTTCPVTTGGAALTCNIDLAKTNFQNTSGVPKNRLVPIGLIYFFSESSDRMQKKVEKEFSMLPVAVRVFYQNPNEREAWWKAENAPGGGLVGSVYISENHFKKISTYNPLSFTVAHEFGHQFMADSYGDRLPSNSGDKNHGGYCYNASSTDAWMEGFASFFGAMVKKYYYNVPDYWRVPLRNSRIDLEVNYKAWEIEEYAAAGILLDLVDQASDYPSKTDDDGVYLSFEELWKILKKPVNNRVIWDVVDLYHGLKAASVGQEDTDKNGLTALDELFVAHGFYERLDIDAGYNTGEKMAFTTRKVQIQECEGKESHYTLGNIRRSPPYVPGSFITFSVKDQAGQEIQNGIVTVRIEYDTPHQKYNFTYELSTEELADNQLYLMMPPQEYPARALIQVGGNGYYGFQTVVVTSEEFWQHVHRQVDEPLKDVEITLLSTNFVIGGASIGGVTLAVCCGGAGLAALAVGLFFFLRRFGR